MKTPMLRRMIQNIPLTRFSGFLFGSGFPSSNCEIISNKEELNEVRITAEEK